jgi:hypothetical protein
MSVEISSPETRAARRADRLPDGLTAAVALGLWRVFFPGLMSADSIAQYGQALTGQYNDWHPPLMAIVLHQCFRIGRGIGLVTFVQCVAGLLGVRALAAAWLDRGRRDPPPAPAAVAAAVLSGDLLERLLGGGDSGVGVCRLAAPLHPTPVALRRGARSSRRSPGPGAAQRDRGPPGDRAGPRRSSIREWMTRVTVWAGEKSPLLRPRALVGARQRLDSARPPPPDGPVPVAKSLNLSRNLPRRLWEKPER